MRPSGVLFLGHYDALLRGLPGLWDVIVLWTGHQTLWRKTSRRSSGAQKLGNPGFQIGLYWGLCQGSGALWFWGQGAKRCGAGPVAAALGSKNCATRGSKSARFGTQKWTPNLTPKSGGQIWGQMRGQNDVNLLLVPIALVLILGPILTPTFGGHFWGPKVGPKVGSKSESRVGPIVDQGGSKNWSSWQA